MIGFWIQSSDASPSPNHSVIKRDRYGNQIRVIQVRFHDGNRAENIEYEHVQLRFYCETEDVIYEKWKFECRALIKAVLLDNRKRVPTLGTFTKYRPHHVRFNKHIKLMACDLCTDFGYLWQAMITALCSIHYCGTPRCPNHQLYMGTRCTCSQCRSCFIFKLKDINIYDLLDHLLCRTENEHFYYRCGLASCSHEDCGLGLLEKLLFNGDGCPIFDGYSTRVVAYRYLKTHEVKGKKSLITVHDSSPYLKFRKPFLLGLKCYIQHQFVKRRQYYFRRILFKPTNSLIPFPSDWVFVSVDFISNYQFKSEVITHGQGTKLAEISYLIIYEKCVVNGVLRQRNYNIFSESTKHSWITAVPGMSWYFKRAHAEFAQRGVTLKLFFVWSDRGPKDFWNAPYLIYMSDIVGETKVCECS